MSIELLQKDVGTWRARIEVLAGPAPNVSTGTMTSRLTCGGTWLVSDYVADAELAPGVRFEGHGMWTFDKGKQKFVGVWADSMMGFLAPGEGTWDAEARTMTYVYEARVPTPEGGERHLKWRQTTRHVDDDTTEFLSFMPDTSTTPMMRATYKRQR